MTHPRSLGRLAAAALLTGAAALAAPAQAQVQRYRLLPEHAFVQFEVLHFGTSTLRGRIGPVDGEVMLDPAGRRGELGLVIDMRRVDTGLKVFDARLAQDDLLASTRHPQAYFVASRFTYDGDALRAVTGEFTFRDVARPLTLTAERFGCRSREGDGARVCGGDFVATLRRGEFGATFGLPFVGDEVTLRIAVQGVAQP